MSGFVVRMRKYDKKGPIILEAGGEHGFATQELAHRQAEALAEQAGPGIVTVIEQKKPKRHRKKAAPATVKAAANPKRKAASKKNPAFKVGQTVRMSDAHVARAAKMGGPTLGDAVGKFRGKVTRVDGQWIQVKWSDGHYGEEPAHSFTVVRKAAPKKKNPSGMPLSGKRTTKKAGTFHEYRPKLKSGSRPRIRVSNESKLVKKVEALQAGLKELRKKAATKKNPFPINERIHINKVLNAAREIPGGKNLVENFLQADLRVRLAHEAKDKDAELYSWTRVVDALAALGKALFIEGHDAASETALRLERMAEAKVLKGNPKKKAAPKKKAPVKKNALKTKSGADWNYVTALAALRRGEHPQSADPAVRKTLAKAHAAYVKSFDPKPKKNSGVKKKPVSRRNFHHFPYTIKPYQNGHEIRVKTPEGTLTLVTDRLANDLVANAATNRDAWVRAGMDKDVATHIYYAFAQAAKDIQKSEPSDRALRMKKKNPGIGAAVKAGRVLAAKAGKKALPYAKRAAAKGLDAAAAKLRANRRKKGKK